MEFWFGLHRSVSVSKGMGEGFTQGYMHVHCFNAFDIIMNTFKHLFCNRGKIKVDVHGAFTVYRIPIHLFLQLIKYQSSPFPFQYLLNTTVSDIQCTALLRVREYPVRLVSSFLINEQVHI